MTRSVVSCENKKCLHVDQWTDLGLEIGALCTTDRIGRVKELEVAYTYA